MYRCEVCNYVASRKYNFDKHLLTKKHQRNITREKVNNNSNNTSKEPKHSQGEPIRSQWVAKNEPVGAKNEPILNKKSNKKSNKNKGKKIFYYCCYCGNKFSSQANKRRHEKHRCKIKKQQNKNEESELEYIKKKLENKEKELENKKKEVNEILESKEKEVNEILESKEKYKREVIDLKKMVYDNQREFIDFAKDSKKKNVSNIYYIQNNFKDALTMNQLLDEWQITYPEWVQASMKGYVAGCTELIENQFIQNKSLSKRPIHCLDPSRGIFLYNDDGTGWMKNAPVDIGSVITNVDTKFNEFNKDYNREVPVDIETRDMKKRNKDDDPIIYHYIKTKLDEFLPPKYKNEENKDSEYEKSKKKIIKNISVKCAFNKPANEKEIII
tara:strand:- start:36 stop:1190 length:1155 start_codon:yes stop_codon:yes gene_type:complete